MRRYLVSDGKIGMIVAEGTDPKSRRISEIRFFGENFRLVVSLHTIGRKMRFCRVFFHGKLQWLESFTAIIAYNT